MKHRIPALLTAAALCLGLLGVVPASAFSDVTDPAVAQAVAVLTSMGIVSGYDDGGYHPGDTLTRAQFCKLAILLENKGDQAATSAYRTLFSDLSASHWAAGYVNLAYTDGLISGYGDGTFGPDDPVTLAQAVTILLHILGYENAAIGPFWPEDYLSKAAQVGLTEGVDAAGDAALTRGQAALLLRNVLELDTADGKAYFSTWAASTVEQALLLDRDAESDSGRLHTAQVYAGGTITYYDQTIPLPEDFVGNGRGTLLLDKSGKVTGFVPDGTAYATVFVGEVTADGFTGLTGVTYAIAKNTPVFLRSDEETKTWSECWYDLDGVTAVDLAYTESGSIELVVVAGLEKYAGTLLTGYYENAAPNAASPSQITLLGQTFDVADEGRASLSAFAVGDKITVTLNGGGEVAFAQDAKDQKAELIGILDSYQNSTAAVTLLSGIQISGTCTSASASDLEDGLVRVNASGVGKLSVSALSGSAATGKWDVAGGTLGKLTVAADVRVFDQVGQSAAVEVDLDDIALETVPASSITYVGTNSAGEVSLIVLSDVTGECYTYGLLKGGSQTVNSGDASMSYTNYTVSVRRSDGETGTYLVGRSVKSGAPGGIAVTAAGKVAGTVTLTKATDVARADFVGSDTVKAGGYLLTISGDVQVYNETTGQWMTLEAAKAYTDAFTVYYDKTPATGGKVRVIIVE